MGLKMNRCTLFAGAAVLLGAGFTVGCKGPSTAADSGSSVLPTPATPKIDWGTDVGLPLDTQTPNPKELSNLVASLDVQHRQDPFSLTPQEKAYDTAQATERLVSVGGNMATDYEPPPPPDDTPLAEEPQPYRRVSGILVGDSVLAIIEMGEGQPAIVRPGMYVPGTPWFVVSIDEEKVVLRRAGNVNPKTITVRLEQRNPNAGGGAGAGGVGQPGGPGPGGGFGKGPNAPTGPRMGGGGGGAASAG